MKPLTKYPVNKSESVRESLISEYSNCDFVIIPYKLSKQHAIKWTFKA